MLTKPGQRALMSMTAAGLKRAVTVEKAGPILWIEFYQPKWTRQLRQLRTFI